MKSMIIATLTVLSSISFAASYTSPKDIAQMVTKWENLNKQVVGFSSVSSQKIAISKIDITHTEHTDIGYCIYEYTAHVTNADSLVTVALDGKDTFSGTDMVIGTCKF